MEHGERGSTQNLDTNLMSTVVGPGEPFPETFRNTGMLACMRAGLLARYRVSGGHRKLSQRSILDIRSVSEVTVGTHAAT